MGMHIRWEVLVFDMGDSGRCTWRFNACFDARRRAEYEMQWYTERGYMVELRVRTTRFQRPEHRTTGGKP